MIVAVPERRAGHELLRLPPLDGFLLSDFCLAPRNNLSKLVAMAALGQEPAAEFRTRLLINPRRVQTVAFSDHPAAMKYRGVMKLLDRRRRAGAAPADKSRDRPPGWKLSLIHI